MMDEREVLTGFKEGKAFEAYRYFGAHTEKKGVTFRVYAPNASGVNLFGDFNSWQEEAMTREEDGIYTFHSDRAKAGDLYKYVIYGWNGYRMEHSDPYGFATELRPGSASRIVKKSSFRFGDSDWMKARNNDYDRPLSVYEVHVGAFRKNPDEEHGWYNYREIAAPLIEHVKKCGYTHIEMMPVCEYPFDGSWGYQLTGYFAPTSRYGTADDLRYLINECHLAGIGVIMDFVPVHFAIDDYALKMFDSTPLYEYYRQGVAESQWGSCMFDHARPEVSSFLISSAYYWIKEFHFDGLRMDAVSNLIYFGGDQNKGENREGMEFVRRLNTILKKKFPEVILFAEDSSSWKGGVTKPIDEGVLGFDYKWNMGWMYDSLKFMSDLPKEKVSDYHKMTFSMWYFYDERFILSLSHDEVVGGAGTILEKMPGNDEEKFAQVRAYYTYMLMHPGKKLQFMGNEIGERTEWNESREVEFELLSNPLHKGLFDLNCDLMILYKEAPAFFKSEYEVGQFEWLYCEQNEKLLYAMRRNDEKGTSYVGIFNFSGQDLDAEELPVRIKKEEPAVNEIAENTGTKETSVKKEKGKEESWKPVLSTAWKKYGGSGKESGKVIRSREGIMTVSVPAMSAVIYEVVCTNKKK